MAHHFGMTRWRPALVGATALALLAGPGAGQTPAPRTPREEARAMVKHIHWLGHDSFRIEADGKVVYLDPWQLAGGPPADLILITHDHHDHCSPEDVARIWQEGTQIVTVAAAAARLVQPVTLVQPGQKLTVAGIPIETVPAYNTSKFRSPGVPFHPKEAGNVGFIVTLGGQRIYHAGDTDVIPEMDSLEVDIALLPVSGTYVMTPEEAAQAAAAIQPKIAIPMHLGRGIGEPGYADRFRQLSPVPVEVLPMEE